MVDRRYASTKVLKDKALNGEDRVEVTFVREFLCRFSRFIYRKFVRFHAYLDPRFVFIFQLLRVFANTYDVDDIR